MVTVGGIMVGGSFNAPYLSPTHTQQIYNDIDEIETNVEPIIHEPQDKKMYHSSSTPMENESLGLFLSDSEGDWDCEKSSSNSNSMAPSFRG